MRKFYVAGNWKMNLALAEARKLIEEIGAKLPKQLPIDLGVFPSAVLLFPIAKAVDGLPIHFGAQNCYFEKSGAFTGEISPGMIKDTGASSVIIGHSERRHILGETGDMLKKKVVLALETGLDVIYCVGETDDEREAGQTQAVLERQVDEVLGADVKLDRVTIAYEPVWAIGTGKTATPAQAQEAHAFIRELIGKRYNAQAASAVRIQYGGSVKASNAAELLSQPDVDGALVGGASLKADEFCGIIDAAVTLQTKG